MDDIIDTSKSATEAWETMGNDLLVYWTDAYLKHSMDEEKNGYFVYRKRWRKYVKEKRHPYYDTVRLFYWKQHTCIKGNKELELYKDKAERYQGMIMKMMAERFNGNQALIEEAQKRLAKLEEATAK
jgi:hypothetical protein